MASTTETRPRDADKLGSRAPAGPGLPPLWARCAIGVLAALVTFGLRVTVEPVWGEGKPFFFLTGVVLAAWYGGLWSGLVATALSPFGMLMYLRSQRGESSMLVSFVAIGVIVSVLTEGLHRSRAAAQQARVKTEEAETARERILSIVAHDLRNPLHTITLATSSLGRSLAADGTRRLDVINRAVARMDRLIGNLLEASQIEAGKLALTLRPEDPSPLVRDIVDALSTTAQSDGVELVNDAGAGLIPAILCDVDRLAQVFANIIANAIKFTPHGGTVHVRAAVDDAFVRFEVTDTGPGIPAKDVARIFDRHWRGGSGGGSGLGLYIARGIVEAHGGTISVDSDPGRGTSVFFRVPRAPSTEAEQRAWLELVEKT